MAQLMDLLISPALPSMPALVFRTHRLLVRKQRKKAAHLASRKPWGWGLFYRQAAYLPVLWHTFLAIALVPFCPIARVPAWWFTEGTVKDSPALSVQDPVLYSWQGVRTAQHRGPIWLGLGQHLSSGKKPGSYMLWGRSWNS